MKKNENDRKYWFIHKMHHFLSIAKMQNKKKKNRKLKIKIN